MMTIASQAEAGADAGWFPSLTQEEAWKRLPKAVAGEGEKLPAWALMLAGPLPRATAAMLELEAAQRTKNSLPPRMRAKLRWVAARAHGCEASQRQAAADFRAAGGGDMELSAIESSPASIPEAERRAVRFVRQLCLESYAITDERAAELLNDLGPKDFAGLVLLTAYANFQDRLLLAMGVPPDTDSLPPPTARFDWSAVPMGKPAAERRAASSASAVDDVPKTVVDAEWSALSPAELDQRLAEQKDRPSRIPVMDANEVAKFVNPKLYSPKAATAIVWHNVTFGYQPELVNAWFFALRQFREESHWVGPFRNISFWVVTRATQCNYCMGHTVMLMEVTGMKGPAIDATIKDLASGDWSNFPAHERIVLHLARNLTRAPSQITREDIDALTARLGHTGAIDAIWHVCWCNFMVRVSNAFQIPLEKDNVFWELHGKKPPAEKFTTEKP